MRAQDHLIDYDAMAEIAEREQPKLIIAGGSAYGRIIDFERFREIADSVGAYLMVDMAHFAGLVAGGRLSRARCRTPTSSPPPPTRPCAGRAAA